MGGTYLVVRDRLALVQALEAILVDRREMDEDVVGPVLGRDEPEPLVAEELDSALVRHDRSGSVLWRVNGKVRRQGGQGSQKVCRGRE